MVKFLVNKKPGMVTVDSSALSRIPLSYFSIFAGDASSHVTPLRHEGVGGQRASPVVGQLIDFG